MIVVPHGALTEVWAPAKLNLALEVLARRPDGYHEIETLMTAVNLYDTLYLRATVSGDIRCRTTWAHGIRGAHSGGLQKTTDNLLETVPPDDQNLVVRALRLFQSRCGLHRGAEVLLIKRIPTLAGLGGASSDAAGALLAANIGWEIGWSRDQLSDLAAEIGSDVPFFLRRAPAWCRGRGEVVTPIRGADRLDVVIIRPPVGLPTAEVYRRVELAEGPRRLNMPQLTGKFVRGRELAGQLSNRLQSAARQLTPWIDKLERAFDRTQVWAHQMSGSGTAYFGICRHAVQANHVAHRLRQRRLGLVYRGNSVPA